MEGKIFMSCCKKIVFNIVDFSMIYNQHKKHVCATTFDKKASDLHILSMCGSIDGFFHPLHQWQRVEPLDEEGSTY